MNNHKLRRYYLEKDDNCAETILRAANEEYHLGLNEDSFRLVSGFGVGMGCGGTCGALSSAMAVISMCLVEERAKAGDLLFWRGHVGMYLGDGRYLHCTGHERVFGCRVNSLRRGDEDFREDLAEALKVVGSVFS